MIEIIDPSILMLDSVKVSDDISSPWIFKVYSRKIDDLRIVSCFHKTSGELLTMQLCHANGKESVSNKSYVNSYLQSANLKAVNIKDIERNRIEKLKNRYGLEGCLTVTNKGDK